MISATALVVGAVVVPRTNAAPFGLAGWPTQDGGACGTPSVVDVDDNCYGGVTDHGTASGGVSVARENHFVKSGMGDQHGAHRCAGARAPFWDRSQNSTRREQ
ncbi:hypothetical protein ADL03_21945 [Nocardia sp. NRRL S-836]|nr:hypothetical protein ADL03_21945 [Nocardia sp. NRRL S-836]